MKIMQKAEYKNYKGKKRINEFKHFNKTNESNRNNKVMLVQVGVQFNVQCRMIKSFEIISVSKLNEFYH